MRRVLLMECFQPGQAACLPPVVLISRWAKKKSVMEVEGSMTDFCGLKSRYSSRQVFWLTDHPRSAPSRLSGHPDGQWHTADLVPAYSAGPTLRIYTVFPFHHDLVQNATPGRVFKVLRPM